MFLLLSVCRFKSQKLDRNFFNTFFISFLLSQSVVDTVPKQSTSNDFIQPTAVLSSGEFKVDMSEKAFEKDVS